MYPGHEYKMMMMMLWIKLKEKKCEDQFSIMSRGRWRRCGREDTIYTHETNELTTKKRLHH